MYVKILGKTYNIETTIRLFLEDEELNTLPDPVLKLANLEVLRLSNNNLVTLPESIDLLTKLRMLVLNNNKLETLPDSISNLVNLQFICIYNNQLTSLPKSILKIKDKVCIDYSSYQLDNLDQSCEFLIFKFLGKPINNLPYNLKEIWLDKAITKYEIKLPFGCVIKKD